MSKETFKVNDSVTVAVPGPFERIQDIIDANERLGHYWFSKATMRGFRSRIVKDVIDGRFFITSEQRDNDDKRKYSIRVATDEGDVWTVGEFYKYASAAEARRVLKKLRLDVSCINRG